MTPRASRTPPSNWISSDRVGGAGRRPSTPSNGAPSMKFLSTRGQTPALSFSDAVATGLAPDGGLFLPETLPDFSGRLSAFEKLSYPELCFEFLRVFATDIPVETLRGIVAQSYTRFSDPAI